MTTHHFLFIYITGATFFAGWMYTDLRRREEIQERLVPTDAADLFITIVVILALALFAWWFFLPYELADAINRRKK